MRTMRLIAAAAIAIAAIWNSSDARAQNRPWGAEYIPNLTVTTQDGKPLHFYDDLVQGQDRHHQLHLYQLH